MTNFSRTETFAIAKMKTLFFMRVFPRFSGGETLVGRSAKALEAFAFVTDKTSSLLYGAWREEKCTRSLQAHSLYSFYFYFILFYFYYVYVFAGRRWNASNLIRKRLACMKENVLCSFFRFYFRVYSQRTLHDFNFYYLLCFFE